MTYIHASQDYRMSKKPKISSTNTNSDTLLDGSRNILLSSQETDGDIYVVKGIMPEGSKVPIHIHTLEDEIFHILEGQVELTLGDKLITGNVGDIIYLPRGIKHGIKTMGKKTAIVLNYVIPGRNFEQFFDALHHSDGTQRDEIAEQYGITFL